MQCQQLLTGLPKILVSGPHRKVRAPIKKQKQKQKKKQTNKQTKLSQGAPPSGITGVGGRGLLLLSFFFLLFLEITEICFGSTKMEISTGKKKKKKGKHFTPGKNATEGPPPYKLLTGPFSLNPALFQTNSYIPVIKSSNLLYRCSWINVSSSRFQCNM